jgi:hypothetical protein
MDIDNEGVARAIEKGEIIQTFTSRLNDGL